MSLEITQIVLNELTSSREAREQLRREREESLRLTIPELREIDSAIARAALRCRQDVPVLMERRKAMVRDWLASQQLQVDYLTPPPTCALCNDTGFVNGSLCVCVRNEVAKRMFAEAGLGPESPSFENYNLDLFSATAKTSAGLSSREQMRFHRDMGLAYADAFPTLQKPNMLFYGKPGRGKTYLMDCIAGRLISRGFWVVRVTSFRMNDIMAKAMFEKADPDSLFECDLLVLDDLGSEPLLNKVTISSLFNLFNERHTTRKPFILSTNLCPEEILQRYGDRVFSRITDARHTRIIEFEGTDLRRG